MRVGPAARPGSARSRAGALLSMLNDTWAGCQDPVRILRLLPERWPLPGPVTWEARIRGEMCFRGKANSGLPNGVLLKRVIIHSGGFELPRVFHLWVRTRGAGACPLGRHCASFPAGHGGQGGSHSAEVSGEPAEAPRQPRPDQVVGTGISRAPCTVHPRPQTAREAGHLPSN